MDYIKAALEPKYLMDYNSEFRILIVWLFLYQSLSHFLAGAKRT